MTSTSEPQEAAPRPPYVNREPSFAWMQDTPTEWGVRARPGPRGLRFADINIGSYGEVPDVWLLDTEIPRGAQPNPDVEAMGYSIFEKQEVWAPSAAELYEDAIQGRWAPSIDLPWDTLAPLTRPLEAAMCQLCTELSGRSYAAGVAIGKWLQEISYGFIEVKNYLATQIFDEFRHAEAFRKRALANGGGLGTESTNHFVQRFVESINFTEMVLCVDLLDAAFLETLYAAGDELAQNALERELFRRCRGDKERHLQYGVERLAWTLEHRPERRLELVRYLRKAEHALVQDMKQPVSGEPLVILFGGGVDGADRGAERLQRLRRAQVDRYLGALRQAGLDHAGFPLHTHLAAFMETEAPVSV